MFPRFSAIAAGALAAFVSLALPSTQAAAKSERLSMAMPYPVGSIVVVNAERKLYYVSGKNEVIRYPVAVGKTEELWMGRTFVSSKVVDPKWIPVDGSDPVEGGDPANPLGKRALYIDWSLLRIHGTPSRGSIGSAVSNGCVRMLNEDVVELFDRVHVGAPVFAIRSLKEATKFQSVKFAEKIYVNPEARKIAKADEDEEIRERWLEKSKQIAAAATKQVQAQRASLPPPKWLSQRYALGAANRE